VTGGMTHDGAGGGGKGAGRVAGSSIAWWNGSTFADQLALGTI
jgi:hypothetical protein